jgi:alcohol dehydrogenase (cytochrome c)
VSAPYVKVNWSKGINAKGSPVPNPAKEPQLDGSLDSPNQGGETNWPPPTFDPDTSLFYVSASRAFSSTTSTIRATNRRAGAEMIAAVGVGTTLKCT